MKPNHPPKLGEIVIAVEAEFDLPAGTLYSPSKRQKICYPRQVAWWMIRDLTPASLPDIGHHFRGKHHTTVLHGVEIIQARLDGDETLRIMGDSDLLAIIQRLRSVLKSKSIHTNSTRNV